MSGWLPHPEISGCGTYPDVPAPFEVLFTTRAGAVPGNGSGPRPDYDRLGAALDCELVRARQVHGAAVLDAAGDGDRDGALRVLSEADGLVTDAGGRGLLALSADCAVLLFADLARGALGSAHSGWRGTAAGLPAVMVERMRRDYGSRPADLRVWIAPTIGACCYEVGDEVFDALGPTADAPGVRVPRRPRAHLDLVAAVRAVLADAGVGPDQVADTGLCTRCRADLLFSYRRDGKGCGHQAGVVLRR